MPTPSVIAVHLRAFRLERCGWTAATPAVLIHPEQNAERVVVATEAATKAGVYAGQTLAEARATLPTLQVERLDPAAESADLEHLARQLDRWSPAVIVVEPDALLLDAPETELDSLLPSLRARFTLLGHDARMVVGPDARSALVLAIHLDADRVVSLGELAGALAPLPIAALGLPPEVLLALADVGVATIGTFARLPLAALCSRYGPELALPHAIANGALTPAPLPILARVDPVSPSLDLPDAIDDLAAAAFVLHGLTRELAQHLAERDEAVSSLVLVLRLDGGGSFRLPAGLGRPVRSADTLFRVLTTRLQGVQLSAPITGLALTEVQRCPWIPTQTGVLDRADVHEGLDELRARLADTLGAVNVGRPLVDPHWAPEAGWHLAPPGTAEPVESPDLEDPVAPHEPAPPTRERPPLLLPEPLPIEVVAALSGRPRAWLNPEPARDAESAIEPLVVVDGPERLIGGWWSSQWARDYWRVSLPDQRQLWIFRQLRGLEPGADTHESTTGRRWFLHGWWEGSARDDAPRAVPAPGARVLSFPGAVSPAGASDVAPVAHPQPAAVLRRPSGPRAYAELLCRSNHSFHEGASFPEELVETAAALGLSALALSDRDGVYGAVRAATAAKKHKMKLIHGALITTRLGAARVDQGGASGSLVALVQDLHGWTHLCRLLTAARAEAPKGRADLPLAKLLSENQGLILILRGQWPSAATRQLKEAVGDRLYQAASHHLRPGDAERLHALARGELPVVATNDARMHQPARQALADALTCIRLGLTLDNAGKKLAENAERHLKSPEKMAQLFREHPDMLARSVEISSRCHFTLDEIKYQYPREVVPPAYNPATWLRELTARGVRERYGDRPPKAVVERIAYELAVIERLDFPSYFLTVEDLVRFARQRGILCQGRGSAANSAVCYVLGITAVDPDSTELLFERFISEERGEPPDIDVDFEHERREEVIQYVYEKYGRHRAAMVNEVIAYRGRMAARDLGKVVGLGPDQIEAMAVGLDHWGSEPPSPERLREAGLDPTDTRLQLLQQLVKQIQGFPRHTSIHVGGFVISDGPLVDRVPVEPASMADRHVIQWDKDDVDLVRFVKVDLLALGMLTAIRKCFGMVREQPGLHYDLSTVPREDPAVYELLSRADSIGVFQVESRAQQSMLPRLRPQCFYDLVIEVSIVRPGPIQGGMVHPYLRRRQGLEPPEYADPRLEPILRRTLGVPIFQEQVMAMAVAVGGFTPGEADALRRAMGAWRKRGGMSDLTERLLKNMLENGITPEYAERIYKQIQGFAEYGFPESHAASFAHLVYVSSWLRVHHPAAFCAGLLNAQPMGFYAPRSLVADVQRHGVEVRPVDVTCSEWDCSLETGDDGPALRLGLRLVRGLAEAAGRRLVAARLARPFTDLSDLARRTELDRGALRKLARADALLNLERRVRREVSWGIDGLWPGLFADLSREEDAAPLPQADAAAELRADYDAVGLAVDEHPIALLRASLNRSGVLPLARLTDVPDGSRVTLAGLVASRQRPGTASGVVFLSLEDETGTANVVVWPKLYSRQRRLVRSEPLVRVVGRVQRQDDAISVVAESFSALRLDDVGPLEAKSRDFH